jgi:monoamine oxidase
MTALDVVDRYMPGGSAGIAGRSYHCYLASYLGLDLRDLGGLAVIDDRASNLRGDDERYHVRGGNDQIVLCLAESLPRDALAMDAPMRSVVRRRDGSFVLRFSGWGKPTHADAVVFCLPFTALREADLEGAGLSHRKRRCIAELGMGTNAKVIMQFAERPQNYGDWNGYLDVDRPFVETWESSAGQPGRPGLITAYFGGRSGASWLPRHVVHGAAPRETVDSVLDALTRRGRTDLPGLRRGFLGRATLDHWSRDPWARGSYAAFLPGQYTRFVGFVGKPEHRMYFAGEHTSPLANQGYLEGAVRTGERAAREVLAAFR